MDVKGARALAERLAQEDEFLTVPEAAIIPETGEVLATRAELVEALRDIEERMGPLYEARRRVRRALGTRFEPRLPERRRDRTKVQEAVSRCPRCGDRLPKEEDVPQLTLTQEEVAVLARLIDPLFREDSEERVVVQKIMAAATGDEWVMPEEPAPAGPPPDLSDSLE
jgi:hypothetical protein